LGLTAKKAKEIAKVRKPPLLARNTTYRMTYHMQKCWFEHTSIKFSLKIFVKTFFHWDHMG